jgi:hypothetical protein
MASMSKRQRVPVSERALTQRINRHLVHDDKALVKSRQGSAARREGYGEWYTIDTRRNQADRGDIDLEKFARELGVLRPWEYLES